jgi:hypothetical protein
MHAGCSGCTDCDLRTLLFSGCLRIGSASARPVCATTALRHGTKNRPGGEVQKAFHALSSRARLPTAGVLLSRADRASVRCDGALLSVRPPPPVATAGQSPRASARGVSASCKVISVVFGSSRWGLFATHLLPEQGAGESDISLLRSGAVRRQTHASLTIWGSWLIEAIESGIADDLPGSIGSSSAAKTSAGMKIKTGRTSAP